ncbi:hypothetical protein [Tautonia plasticadhaerens]|uniref:Uncharacterized protein n=1 Tax=Tautonia plasticadhaerens TaxID=2527974 RepID=A0A518H0K6_9BACT|nr:hypothetical protein [Tautonia plasticadhaerens]QDV34370.1 hypothetical protein ElP_22550 [Tautonia plasticadhaerens]
MPLPGLVHLSPGVEVGQGPPNGWDARVVRSVPRLASGDLGDLPRSAAATATRFRTVIVADVAGSSRSGYRLARVGVGNAVPVGDRELVVTPGGPDEALDAIPLVDRVVLIAAEAKLGEGSIAARTPTFALFRTPTVLAVDGEHRDLDLCYALLVDPETGALDTFCWPAPPGPSPAPGSILLLPPDLTFDATLDARATRRIGPLAVSWSFALDGPPPGLRVEVPPAVAPGLARPDGPIDARAMEWALRALLPASR